jgi:hypothetical protein
MLLLHSVSLPIRLNIAVLEANDKSKPFTSSETRLLKINLYANGRSVCSTTTRL